MCKQQSKSEYFFFLVLFLFYLVYSICTVTSVYSFKFQYVCQNLCHWRPFLVTKAKIDQNFKLTSESNKVQKMRLSFGNKY